MVKNDTSLGGKRPPLPVEGGGITSRGRWRRGMLGSDNLSFPLLSLAPLCICETKIR